MEVSNQDDSDHSVDQQEITLDRVREQTLAEDKDKDSKARVLVAIDLVVDKVVGASKAGQDKVLEVMAVRRKEITVTDATTKEGDQTLPQLSPTG